MKKRGFVALLILVISLGVVIINDSLRLLNQPDDFAVIAAIVQILLVFIIAPTVLIKVYRRTK